MSDYRVIRAEPRHFGEIIELTKRVYATSPPWRLDQLESHLRVFPEGQLVAVHGKTGRVGGYAASLIVRWDDYDDNQSWRDFTDHGMFTNHDAKKGRTLYGAEILVDPKIQRQGIGSKIYNARRELVQRLQLRRIRAGARLRGYGKHADKLEPADYIRKVIQGDLKDPTLSFQLKHGFKVVGVVSGYLRHDEESRGYAAIIEWLNVDIASRAEIEEHKRHGFHK